MERRDTKRWKLALLVACTIAASALVAYAISSALDQSQHTSSQAKGAAATSCYASDKLLWSLDRASWGGYQRDLQAASFLRAVARRAKHGQVVEQLAANFQAAADDAYWQPLVDCSQVVNHPHTAKLRSAVPISTVPDATIRRTLAAPPQPPH